MTHDEIRAAIGASLDLTEGGRLACMNCLAHALNASHTEGGVLNGVNND